MTSWSELLKEHVYLLQLGALVVAAGILILNAAQTVFERLASAPTAIPPIASPPVPTSNFRYLNDPAEDARHELADIVHALRAVLFPFSWVIVISLVLGAFLDFVKDMGSDPWQSSVCLAVAYRPALCAASKAVAFFWDWWKTLEAVRNLLGMLDGIVILFGSYVIFKLASIVYHVVHARRIG